MPKYKVVVTEINDAVVAAPGAQTVTESEIFKLVVDQFEPTSFVKAITAQRRRRKAKTEAAA